MVKVLLKKQLMEFFAFFTQGKGGKRRPKGAVIGFSALMLYAVVAVVAMFWLLSGALCEPYVSAGLTWVYFAFIATMATAFGVVGGVFMTKSTLYEAKDNELLLSMPAPPWAILFSRLVGVYAITFLFEGLVFIPAVVRYFTVVGVSLLPMVFLFVITLILPLGALAICCLLGWLVALIIARMRSKNLFTILLSFVFMAVYVLVYMNFNEYLVYVMEHGEAVGTAMKTSLYPFYQLGLAATGDPLAMLIFLGLFVGAFALIYYILSKTYLRIIISNRGGKRAKYKAKEAKRASVGAALLKREALRFFKCAAYLLNASMGVIFIAIVSVLCLVKGDLFGMTGEVILAAGGTRELSGLIVSLCICISVAMNVVSSSSISLEGENIWIAQSLPVDTWEVLKAKLGLHILVTALPAAGFAVIAGIVMDAGVLLTALSVIVGGVFTFFTAAFGLAANLKFPNLRWTSETVAVKQGAATLLAMLGNIAVVMLLVGGYFLFGKYMPAVLFTAICILLLAAACAALVLWLKKRGVKIFESL